ncbi:MAG: hypothetical protein IJ511_05460 [Bacteroides sp.]|nr:hypothetical protein [Bacteroides sp.]
MKSLVMTLIIVLTTVVVVSVGLSQKEGEREWGISPSLCLPEGSIDKNIK